MKKRKLSISVWSFALLLTMQMTAWAAVPTVTQSITLDPGWNAVYLNVQPLANSPAEVFRNLPPGSSVWAWTGKHESVQFIQDPNETPIKIPLWLALFTAPDQASLNNLYSINSNSAYLVRLPGGSPPLTLDIVGRPTIRHKEWIPDSLNLVGFDFFSPPTFEAFFASSPSHKNQPIYRLNNHSGAWEIVNNPATTPMRSGEAFWIRCQAGSDYQGPFTVEADGADGLNFGAGITSLKLTIANSTEVESTISLAQDTSSPAAANPVILAHRHYDPTVGLVLTTPLSGMTPVTVKANGSAVITLAVKRGSFSGEAASVLEFSDGRGNRLRMPVTAVSNASTSYPGLWTGVATLNRVSLVSELTGTAPDFATGEAKPTPAELNLNLILHQDDGGQVRLLKQVIMMYQDETLAAPGRYVILTQDALIPNYSGVTQRDGSKVGRRISAVGYDYSPSSSDTDYDDTALKCIGSLSGTVSCSLVLDSSSAVTAPTNPFLHRYHPDHDNLGSDYTTFKQEANRIEREIMLVFDGAPKVNPDNPPPGWGVSVLGGSYSEVIKGLAKGPIKVEGDFILNLATDVNVLNQ